MKKLITILAVLVSFTSCYEDYIKDYDNDAVYFPFQVNSRTFVVGEGMKIEVGVALGGVRDNKSRREVDFVLDNSLISPAMFSNFSKNSQQYIKDAVSGLTELKPMPTEYVTMSNSSQFIIEPGNHVGTIVIRPDSVKFLSDATTLKSQYALPFKITRADADSILDNKDYAVIGLRYENMLFGNYWHGGVTVVKDTAGNEIPERKSLYYTAIPQPEAKVWKLTTVAPFDLVTNRISDKSGSFKITLNSDGSVTIGKAPNSTVNVEPDGVNYFNKAKLLQDRKIFLSYKYQNGDGTTSYAKDTLTFRNRIRDGVNEWQDENAENYE